VIGTPLSVNRRVQERDFLFLSGHLGKLTHRAVEGNVVTLHVQSRENDQCIAGFNIPQAAVCNARAFTFREISVSFLSAAFSSSRVS